MEKVTQEEPKTNPNYLNGVFYFSNASDEDFIALWNNIEYLFPANTCSPIIIPGEPPESIQTIRKKWAYKFAVEQWFKGREYKKMVKEGGRIPAIPNEKVYEPLIQMCLNPLPIKEATTKAGKKDKRNYSNNTKPVKSGASLNEEFKDAQPETLGEV